MQSIKNSKGSKSIKKPEVSMWHLELSMWIHPHIPSCTLSVIYVLVSRSCAAPLLAKIGLKSNKSRQVHESTQFTLSCPYMILGTGLLIH